MAYDADLDWWFGCGASLLGQKGNLSTTIGALERGGSNVGVFVDPQEEWTHVDWYRHGEQLDRERQIRRRFFSLPLLTQELLAARYSTRPLKVPHLSARFGELAGLVLYLAKGADNLARMSLREIKAIEAEAGKQAKETHAQWRATRPRKVRDVLQDFQIPLAS